MVSFRFGFDACNAGTNPKISAVRKVMATVKASARPSTETLLMRGKSDGARVSNKSVPHFASNNPTAPPARDNSMLSVSSWRMMRQRPAPSAVRVAISLCLPAARASNRFATLAQAINRTKATATRRTSKAGLMVLTEYLSNGMIFTFQPVLPREIARRVFPQ